MNVKSGFLIVFVSLFFFSCNDNCVTGAKPIPASFFVTFIDETTGENVFENATFSETDISIIDIDNEDVPFDFITDLNAIHVFPKANKVASNKYLKYTLNNETTLLVKEIESLHGISESVGECFNTHKVINLVFPNNDSEVINTIYVVKI